MILRTFGPLHVDLFASVLNAQLRRYCTKTLDPAVWRLDAFSFRWEGFTGYAFSPDIHHPPNTTESETGSGNHPPHCPVVAEENVVSRHDNPRSGVPENPSRSPGYDLSADIGDSAPAAGRPPPDCLALVREAGAQAGLSDRAATFVACSRRESTRETFNSRLTGFFSWCESHGVFPRSAPLTDVTDFFDRSFR